MSRQTPSQTVGPFFHLGLIRPGQETLVDERTRGQRIAVCGQVRDGADAPVPDAMLETWQADGNGIYDHPLDPRREEADSSFAGWGRAATDADGRYWFRTIRPGAVPSEDGTLQAPHINLRVFARGLLVHVTSRIYFPGEPANQDDPVLDAIRDPARRNTLIAAELPGEDLPTYRFDVVLQGDEETVFFDL